MFNTLPELSKQQGGGQNKTKQNSTCFSFSCNQNKIEDIKTKQSATAEDIILLQFRMEKLVYCQDQIYSTVLQRKRKETFNPLLNASQMQEASVSAITEISVHLDAYFCVSVGAPRPSPGVLTDSC